MKFLTQHMTKMYTPYDKKLDKIHEFLRQRMNFLTQRMKYSAQHMLIICATYIKSIQHMTNS